MEEKSMKTRTLWLAALALLAIFIISGTVFAEGEEPPDVPDEPAVVVVEAPPAPTGVQETPVEPVTVVEETPPQVEPQPEVPVLELPAAEEEPITEEAPVIEELINAELAVEDAEVTQPIAEELAVEAETPILVDAEGEPLVLATEETAELLVAPDPYFYISSVPYQFTTADCNPGIAGNQPCPNPLLAAIAYIDTNALVPDDGFIYVEKATYTGNVVIDYVAKPNLSSLTGLIGLPTLGLYPTISGSLSLLNLDNGFTLEGFNITGGVFINNSDGQFYIDKVSAPLSMTDVNANSNSGSGILVSDHKGNATLTRVTANDNDELGIYILNHAGHIFFDTVTANDNGSNGAAILNDTGIYNITIKNSLFNHNGLNEGISGSLSIWSNGLVTLNGVVANDSNDSFGGSGIRVRSGGASLLNVIANNNAGNGIHVQLRSGSILLENAVANSNSSVGVNVELRDKDGNEIFYPANVTIKNLVANDNNINGLLIRTLGTVTISNSSTDRNTNGDGTKIETNGAVTITNLGACNNGENGLFVRTKGAITITGIYAGSNGFSGADLDNGLCTWDEIAEKWTCLGSGAIQVKNTSDHMNDLSSNDHFGLWAVSKGVITITNLRATDNDSDGAYVTNRFGGSTAGITVNTLGTVRNEFSNNGWYEVFQPDMDDYYQVLANGLTALSAGNISVTNTDAWQNHSGGGGIYLDTKFSTAPRTVSLSNSNAGENDWVGVWIWSRGNITLTNVSANDNHTEAGIHVDNCRDYDPITDEEDGICSLSGNIALTNIETHNNGGIGIEALSKGTITLNGANSSNNWEMGISLANNFSGATAGITLTNINANDNNNTGLSATTNGAATLTTINTHNNAKRNGYIETGQTVQDFSNGNYGPDMWWFNGEPGTTYNFMLKADASQVLNRTDFDPWIELYDADDPETSLGVTITCEESNYCSFSFDPGDAPFGYTEAHKFYVKLGSNTNDGFYRLGLNNPVIDDNNQMFWVNGTAITAGGSITVKGIGSTSNTLMGLGATVMGNGSITLSNLDIYNNGAEGVYLTCGQKSDWSDSGFGIGSITLSGSNNISDNGWDGLVMATSGNVTLGNLDAHWNGQPNGSNGISIRDDHAAKAVTLSSINVGDNGRWGLWFIATGNIALTNINAWQSQNEGGIFLDNCLDGFNGEDDICFGTGTIKLTTVTSDNNQGKGIEIYSKGLITLSGVHANNNQQTGIRAINEFDLATAGITLTNVRAESNNGSGITAWTNGALTMSNINANSNYLIWGGIDNGTTVQNYYSSNREPDHWWFEAVEDDPITLTLWADGSNDSDWLNRWDFDPFLQVFQEFEDGSRIEITSNQAITSDYNSGTLNTDFYQIVWTPDTGEGGWYYLEVSSDNGNSGFYRLSVDDGDPSDAQVYWVDGLTYHAGGNVALSGTNNFSDNEQAGLIGWNNGNVTLANIFAWGNGCEGIYVDNTGGSGNVTLSGTNGSGGNGWEGLRIITDGTVSVSNLEANNNGQDGIWIVANTALKAVTLNNIVAMWNGINGLNLNTHGITTLNNVRAWFNTEDGANVDTNGYRLTLLNSSFICNDDDGFAYMGYINTPPMLPFVFTNTNNIFLGNGDDNLVVLH